MTPRIEVFCLEVEDKLSKVLIRKIYESGNFRTPIYKENFDNIIRMLFTKELINEKYYGEI
ncbi:hypothetical protein K8R62_00795 [bacterium]|nr:hypothetical protein [bacterium]